MWFQNMNMLVTKHPVDPGRLSVLAFFFQEYSMEVYIEGCWVRVDLRMIQGGDDGCSLDFGPISDFLIC